jgi:two-component system sensor histidine kinase YesM
MLMSRMQIKYQLIILAVSIMLVITVIFFIYYSENVSIIDSKNNEYTSETMLQIKQSVSEYCDRMDRFVTSISYTSIVQDYLLGMEDDPEKIYEQDTKIGDLLNNMKKNVGDGILDIVVIGDNGNYSTLNGAFEYVDNVKELFDGKNATYFTGIKDIRFLGRDTKCILAGMSIVSIDKYRKVGKKIGVFCVIIDPDKISQEMGTKWGTSSSVHFFLLDRDGSIFSNNAQIPVGTPFDSQFDIDLDTAGSAAKGSDQGENLVQTGELPELGGRVVSIVPKDLLYTELRQVRSKTLLMFLLAFVLLLIPLSIVINNILKPLREFMSFLSEIGSGNLKNLKKKIHLHGYAEITVMSQEFNSMLDEVDHLTHRLVDTSVRLFQSELDKKQAELAFLQSQINPHFLYNTLESIKGIAAVKGVTEIRDMTKALAQIFRYSVSGTDLVRLEEEINIIRSYTQIQQIRFADRFRVYYELSPEALACEVPKMILQPLVENAIYHGLEEMLEQGELHISGKVEAGKLIVVIRDNGQGIDADTMERLRDELAVKDVQNIFLKAEHTSIGIANVNSRIRLKYGDQYGISVFSEPGAGTDIVLSIAAGGQPDA